MKSHLVLKDLLNVHFFGRKGGRTSELCEEKDEDENDKHFLCLRNFLYFGREFHFTIVESWAVMKIDKFVSTRTQKNEKKNLIKN